MPANKDSDSLNAPKASAGDRAHAIVKGGLGAIPYLGSSFAEVFNILVRPPIERRRDEWMGQVVERLVKLEEAGEIRVEDLQRDDGFMDVLLNATHTALRSSQNEKKEALRNAILNTALKHAPEESLRHMFIGWIDQFTEWHLRMLDLFDNPTEWAKRNNHKFPNWAMTVALSHILESAYPEMKQRQSFCDLVWDDLHSRRLVNRKGLETMMSASGAFESSTSAFGRDFLIFIREPDTEA